MNEDKLNMDIRRFLKKVGVTSQREIEHAIFKAIEAGALQGNESLALTMTLEVPAVGISHTIEDVIEME